MGEGGAPEAPRRRRNEGIAAKDRKDRKMGKGSGVEKSALGRLCGTPLGFGSG